MFGSFSSSTCQRNALRLGQCASILKSQRFTVQQPTTWHLGDFFCCLRALFKSDHAIYCFPRPGLSDVDIIVNLQRATSSGGKGAIVNRKRLIRRAFSAKASRIRTREETGPDSTSRRTRSIHKLVLVTLHRW